MAERVRPPGALGTDREAGDDPPAPDLARLGELAALLRRSPAVRFVDYRRAERDCEVLAARLLDGLGRERLRGALFTAIPRGGLIVLGMLAYWLDLEADQLVAPRLAPVADPPAAKPPRAAGPSGADPLLVVVDDCALTGYRFGTRLAASPHREVVFAHLYSHPDLRRAIVAAEPRVVACVAAHDLADHAAESHPDETDREAWRRRWHERLGPGRYWVGRPELVSFAWSEPARPTWNPAVDRVEEGWRLLPPHLCLGNRVRLVAPSQAARSVGWRQPEAVASGEVDGVVWLCDTRSGEVVSLTGVAAEMWRRVAGWGSLEAAVTDLAGVYAAGEAEIRRDIEALAADLAARGFLERAE